MKKLENVNEENDVEKGKREPTLVQPLVQPVEMELWVASTNLEYLQRVIRV